jgi:cytochrome b6-f complex iron-sulfur subunit
MQDKRRDFLKISLSMAGLAICSTSLGALVQSCTSNPVNTNLTGNATIDITTEPALLNNGGAVKKSFSGQFGDNPVIIVRESDGTFMAFSSVCTHEGKLANAPANASSDIICPSHNSHFSAVNGSVKSGPASSPLQKFTTSFNATSNILTITS